MSPSTEKIAPTSIRADSVPKLYFPTLDGLRFIAFLLVFVHHLPKSGNSVLALLHDQGWVGVHVFLFLSAFLLTAILRSEHDAIGDISIKKFYIRRGLRIWPLYFLFCICAFVLTNRLDSQAPPNWIRFTGLMAFVDNVVTGVNGYNPIRFVAHLWTISLEEQFYLVLPLLLARLLIAPASLIRALISLWALFVGMRVAAVLLHCPHPMIWTSVFSADSLLLGTALGAIRPRLYTKLFFRFVLVAVGLLALFSGAFLPPIQDIGYHQVVIYSLVAFGAAALTMAVLHEPLLGFLKAQPFRYLGKVSYGLYVFHFLGITIGSHVARLIGVTSWLSDAAIALAVTIVLSVLSYELFERHFLKFKRHFETVRSRPV